MIDPTKITNYGQSQAGLEEVLLFWVCAAGKNGVTAAKCLDRMLSAWREKVPRSKPSPFKIIQYISAVTNLAEEMKKNGIGCYNAKSRTFEYLTRPSFSIDLKRCGVEDLESVPGIGPKTARCFLIHSRPNQQYAGLDTHVLKFLRDKGHEVPMSTPSGKKYGELEKVFLKYAADSGKSVADFDLMIWNDYRNRRAS